MWNMPLQRFRPKSAFERCSKFANFRDFIVKCIDFDPNFFDYQSWKEYLYWVFQDYLYWIIWNLHPRSTLIECSVCLKAYRIGCQNLFCEKCQCRRNDSSCKCTTEELLIRYKNAKCQVFGWFKCSVQGKTKEVERMVKFIEQFNPKVSFSTL